MNAVADKLREARALIERGWTQGVDARDAFGEECDPYCDDAECFCANGAMCRAFARVTLSDRDIVRDAEAILNEAIGRPARNAVDWPFIDWNDAPERTHAEVLAAFDKAIELAESGR